MNKRIVQLITSTGLLVEDKKKIILFCDKYNAFIKIKNKHDEPIHFLSNFNKDILIGHNIIEVYKFFYFYPLEQEGISLYDFFRNFLFDFEFFKKKYDSFIWNIGRLEIKETIDE